MTKCEMCGSGHDVRYVSDNVALSLSVHLCDVCRDCYKGAKERAMESSELKTYQARSSRPGVYSIELMQQLIPRLLD